MLSKEWHFVRHASSVVRVDLTTANAPGIFALFAILSIVASSAHAQSVLMPNNRVVLQNALEHFEMAQSKWTTDPDKAMPLFLTAAEEFESLVRSGIRNGALEYNLGNCYLQMGDIGRAMLHYRRAERLLPRDPLLADNLSVARRRCLVNIESTRQTALLRNLFFWHAESSSGERFSAALVLYICGWLLLTLRAFLRRRAITGAALGSLALAVVLGTSVAADYWLDKNRPAGVVSSMDVVVYKGPGTGYQRLFEQPMQPGVEFRRREARFGWWNIELPNGQRGWIDAAHAALVPDDVSNTYITVK